MKKLNLICVILSIYFVSFISGSKHDIYKGYTVYNIVIKDNGVQKLIHEMESTLNIDVWSHGYMGKVDATVMVSPEHQRDFLNNLNMAGVDHSLHLDNVVKALDDFDQNLLQWRKQRNGRTFPFEDYPRHAEVNEYLEKVALEHPDIVTLVTAGPSFDGREIKYLKISSSNFTDTSKPVIFMDAMIHAREWVATPVTLYAIYKLVENLSNEEQDLLDDLDWIILPVVNPDGYEYTHTDARLWRRTRSYNATNSANCYGVDGNRNFDVFFDQFGTSPNPCNDIYAGPMPFSEVETQYVRDIIHEYLDRMETYVNFHSYGNMILFGYGDYSLPPNALDLHFVGAAVGAAIDAVKLPEAWHYVIGNSAMILYDAAGAADDYALATGVPLSYCIELPGYSEFFLVSPEYIPQINHETWQGIVSLARNTKLFYSARRNN